MISGRWKRSGFTVGDFVLLLALGSLSIALLYPTLRARTFQVVLSETLGDVEALRSGASRFWENNGSWPTPSGPGAIPPELIGMFPGHSTLTRDEYSLQWTSWEIVTMTERVVTTVELEPDDQAPDSAAVELVPVVSDIGGVVLYSTNQDLLAELLSSYGSTASFVRDTTWTLVVPRAPAGR